MNTARIAELLRELADALEEAPAQNDVEEVRKPKLAKARQRARPFPAPLNPVSDIDRARAVQMLRRRGIGP